MKKLEAKTVFGKSHKWADIEADEVDLGKEGDSSGKVKWEQWGGIVERGQPQTLVLYRLSPKLSPWAWSDSSERLEGCGQEVPEPP